MVAVPNDSGSALVFRWLRGWPAAQMPAAGTFDDSEAELRPEFVDVLLPHGDAGNNRPRRDGQQHIDKRGAQREVPLTAARLVRAECCCPARTNHGRGPGMTADPIAAGERLAGEVMRTRLAD